MKHSNISEKTGDFHQALIESLKNEKKAAAYLEVALQEYQEDGDTEIFMLALRNITEARGGIGRLAKQTNLNRQNLYHTLSGKGNPRLNTLGFLLKELGFRLSVRLHPLR